MANPNQTSQNNSEVSPTAKKAAVVVGITILAAVAAIVLALTYKLITWILGI